MEKRREKKERSRASPQSTMTADLTKPMKKEAQERNSYEMTPDDLDHLRQLRAAGIHGNPMKILSVFHQCNQSIELTQNYLDEERARRYRNDETRLEVKRFLTFVQENIFSLLFT